MGGGVLNQNLTCVGNQYSPTAGDIIKCIIIIIIMSMIIVGNIICLIVVNGPKTKKMFLKRVRYMMTSLCVTDLSIGALVCPSTIYSAIYHCWPFGEAMCKIEALLISALFHESTLNMVLIAIDRYCIVHFTGYNVIMTSRRFLFVIFGTWIAVFFTYAVVIFAGEQFYFDEIGINCEPFYENADVTLSVISIFYFVPLLLIAFCYLSIYKTATRRKVLSVSSDDKHGKMVNANIRTTKYLVAITVGFFVAVSPWNLCTLIVVAAKIKLNQHLDYAVTWLALSNSFWNCLIYGVMNRKFRRAAARLTCGRWVRSLREAISSKEGDTSRDFSEDSLSHSQSTKKRYFSRKKSKTSKNMLDINNTKTGSSAFSSPRDTPTGTPLGTPRITPKVPKETNVSHNEKTTDV